MKLKNQISLLPNKYLGLLKVKDLRIHYLAVLVILNCYFSEHYIKSSYLGPKLAGNNVFVIVLTRFVPPLRFSQRKAEAEISEAEISEAATFCLN